MISIGFLALSGSYIIISISLFALILLSYRHRRKDPRTANYLITAFVMEFVAMWVKPMTHSLVRRSFQDLAALPVPIRAEHVATRLSLHGLAWSGYGAIVLLLLYGGLRRLFRRMESVQQDGVSSEPAESGSTRIMEHL